MISRPNLDKLLADENKTMTIGGYVLNRIDYDPKTTDAACYKYLVDHLRIVVCLWSPEFKHAGSWGMEDPRGRINFIVGDNSYDSFEFGLGDISPEFIAEGLKAAIANAKTRIAESIKEIDDEISELQKVRDNDVLALEKLGKE
jgi:hypothetical protein